MSDIVSLKATPSSTSRLHHAQERQVGFGDGFEEPIFLEKIFVLRMPDKRQMRVEDEREMSRACVEALRSESVAAEERRFTRHRFNASSAARACGRNPGSDRGPS